MPAWKNGGPKKVYLLVENRSGDLWVFDSFSRRKWWLKENNENPSVYTLLTYVQAGERTK